MDSKSFNIGDRVLVGHKTSHTLRRGTVAWIVAPDGSDGFLDGLYRVRFDSGRQLRSDAKLVSGRDMMKLPALSLAKKEIQ